jgi:hypothetical protein
MISKYVMTTQKVELSSSWSLIPYLKDNAMSAPTALESLGSHLVIVKSSSGGIYTCF